MDIKDLQRTWDEYGKTNSFWSILTNAGKWDTQEFFRIGQNDIDGIMTYVDSLNMNTPLRHTRALDFGCGAGRLTQALCKHFDHVCGVDIAPSMIELAERFNKYGGRCKYYVNGTDNLQLFESNSFDFVYTTLVLQHMQPLYSKNYIKEFLRIIRPGGLAIFHMPAEPLSAKNAALRGLKAATEPLPNSAFRAKIRMTNPPTHMKPGSRVVVITEVTNISDTVWPATGDTEGRFRVQLGNHWLNPDGTMRILDEERCTLPHDIQPQETVELPIAVTSPAEEGIYILELDMVQEAVDWFKTRGSVTARVTIKNRLSNLATLASLLNKTFLSSKAKAEAAPEPAPRMQMYGVPKQEVIDLVESSNGIVLDIQDDQSAGQDWLCYRYCVTK